VALPTVVHCRSDFGLKVTTDWQNTVVQGRQGKLDVSPYPLGVDIVSGLYLNTPFEAVKNPLTASGMGQQTTWITSAALKVLQTNTPVYVMGGP